MLTFPFISTHCQIPFLFDVFIAYKNKCKGNLIFLSLSTENTSVNMDPFDAIGFHVDQLQDS